MAALAMDDTLAALFNEATVDDDRGAIALSTLRQRTDRAVFTFAKKWLRADEAARRACAANVLATMDATVAKSEERWKLVHASLKKERSTSAIEASLGALCAIDAAKALPIVKRYLKSTEEAVRMAVARVLGQNDDDASFAMLLELTRDASEELRDWATFAVSSLSNRDSAQLRDALAARLVDESVDTRQEALAGLAARRDPRAVPALIEQWSHKKDARDSVLTDTTLRMLGLARAPEGWTPREFVAALESATKAVTPSGDSP